MQHKILFIFIDGIGMGPDSSTNPFAIAAYPALMQLIGGRLLDGVQRQGPGLLVKGIDATLGVSGLPQSATGQTTLFTGVNAAQAAGFHVPAYPIKPLTTLLARFSVLKRAREQGKRVTFANAYGDAYWQRKRPRHSATTLATMAAGIPFRDERNLLAGEAVYWDITREVARASYAPHLPIISPEDAGRHLAGLLTEHDLVLYETFLTDLAGHRRLPWTADKTLQRIDGMLAGVLQTLPPEATLLITSDHGNFEDASTRAHTYNPAPLIVAGPAAGHFAGITDLTGVTPAILQALDDGSEGRKTRRPVNQ